MKTNRRYFLAGAAALATGAWTGSAWRKAPSTKCWVRRDAVTGIPVRRAGRQQRRQGSTNLPIFAPADGEPTSNRRSQQYSRHRRAGRLAVVPGQPRSCSLAYADPAVVVLRKRLMISGDLSTSAGISPTFDTYVDAALKRFQARHGLPADGVHRQIHLCGDECVGAGAPRPARDQSGALALDVGLPRQPLRDGQHAGRADRGGRERPRRRCATRPSSARSTARRRS